MVLGEAEKELRRSHVEVLEMLASMRLACGEARRGGGRHQRHFLRNAISELRTCCRRLSRHGEFYCPGGRVYVSSVLPRGRMILATMFRAFCVKPRQLRALSRTCSRKSTPQAAHNIRRSGK